MPPEPTTPTTPTEPAAAAAPAPEPLEVLEAPETAPGAPGFDVRRLALYAMVAGGVALYVVLRARTIAQHRMAREQLEGGAAGPTAATVALEHLPAELQVVLRQYEHGTAQRLEVAAANLERITAELATFRTRIAALEAASPIAGRLEPFDVPADTTVSARPDDTAVLAESVDGGTLEAVPAMVSDGNGTD